MQKGKDDNQFDITEALKTRKPLRKTTKVMVSVGSEDCVEGESVTHSNRLQRGKLNANAQGER